MQSSDQPLLIREMVLFVLVAFASGGCLASGHPSPARELEYSIMFENTSGPNLNDVQATWQSHDFPWVAGAGFLPRDGTGSGSGKGAAFQPDPIPDRVEVTWTTPDRVHHSQKVVVASKVPDIDHFTGTIYLKYVSGNWKVVAVSKAERDRRADEGLPIIPAEPPDRAQLDNPAGLVGNAPVASRPVAAATRPVPEKIAAPGRNASGAEKSAIIDALKYSHLASMRAELLRMGNYCQSPDAPTQRFIDACSKLSTSAHHLSEAVRAKFGKQAVGELQLELPEPSTVLKESWPELKESGDPFPAELDRAKVQVHGDRATVQMGGESLDVHKVDGRWKVQIPSLAQLTAAMGLGGDPHADADHMARDCRLSAEIDEQLAADVRAGKFQAAAQVGEARAKRQSEMGERLQKDPDFGLKQQPEGK